MNNSRNLPFVFKLRGVAGSRNVKLVKDNKQTKNLVNQMFGKGMYPVLHTLKDPFPKIQKHKKNKDWIATLIRAPKTLYRIFKKKKNSFLSTERGYFLTQEFYPDNKYDTRITIIGEKAFGYKRKVRPDDFRASGSGLFEYNNIDKEMIKIAFRTADKIRGISLAFDFIYDTDNTPKILEVSYCYVPEAITLLGGSE